MTCAICGGGNVSGVFRDALGRPVHYVCKRRLEDVRAVASTITATGTPPRARRQSVRRVRKW